MSVRVNLGGGNYADLEPELYEVDAALLEPTAPNPVVSTTPERHGWVIREYADGHFDAAQEPLGLSPGFDTRDEAVFYVRDACEPQTRIIRALQAMPYLPLSSYYSTQPEPETLARTLECFAEALAGVAERAEQDHAELVQLRNDVAAVRRVFGAV